MRSVLEIQSERDNYQRQLDNAREFRNMRRLNNGHDEDFEAVMERMISVLDGKVQVLRWVLGEGYY